MLLLTVKRRTVLWIATDCKSIIGCVLVNAGHGALVLNLNLRIQSCSLQTIRILGKTKAAEWVKQSRNQVD